MTPPRTAAHRVRFIACFLMATAVYAVIVMRFPEVARPAAVVYIPLVVLVRVWLWLGVRVAVRRTYDQKG